MRSQFSIQTNSPLFKVSQYENGIAAGVYVVAYTKSPSRHREIETGIADNNHADW